MAFAHLHSKTTKPDRLLHDVLLAVAIAVIAAPLLLAALA